MILPRLELTEIQLGDIIDQPGQPIQHLYFPLRAAISVTDILDEHHTVEVTITGAEGCSGASIVQGSDQAVCMALVQIGGPAARLATSTSCLNCLVCPFCKGPYSGTMRCCSVMQWCPSAAIGFTLISNVSPGGSRPIGIGPGWTPSHLRRSFFRPRSVWTETRSASY